VIRGTCGSFSRLSHRKPTIYDRTIMRCFSPKETYPGETRTAIIPATATRFIKLGLSVTLESGLGTSSSYPDADFQNTGANITPASSTDSAWDADLVLRVRRPSLEEVRRLKPGTIHISFLDPFQDKNLICALADAGVTALSMEMIPRTTLAQKMDALSSQANLAGYYAVIKSAERIDRILPMMMTAAGTLSPARVFIIGAGVAGLQAIATARRLGARVEAFDTRPVVEEQVRSLGAKFVKIDLGKTGQTAQGYAQELKPEQILLQQEGMKKICATSDIVITTAKLFGRPAPRVITSEMLAAMKPGSVVFDLAAETGGNVEGSQPDEEVRLENGVRIIGYSNPEGSLAHHASQMYASNLANLIEHFWDADANTLRIDLQDEIMQGCLITHGGKIVHPLFKS